MNFPIIENSFIEERLIPPGEGMVRMVLDTDTYNEVDDQFALVQAMLAPERLEVEAICAAPFHNNRSNGPADGMKKSYEEIVRLLEMLGKSPDGFVWRGSEKYLPADTEPVESEAARQIIELAMKDDPRPLYVVAIGAITNVASAILLEPEIIKKIVVVWLGGTDVHRESAGEFNLSQDMPAARIIFNSGVPFMRVPCINVASHLITTKAELRECIKGKSELGDYLFNIVDGYGSGDGWSKVIWDISATSWLINPEWIPSSLIPSPVLTNDGKWLQEKGRHPVREATFVHRDQLFTDVFRRINASGK